MFEKFTIVYRDEISVIFEKCRELSKMPSTLKNAANCAACFLRFNRENSQIFLYALLAGRAYFGQPPMLSGARQ
jgi:hypothetical protein